ncbi:MAG TPA: 50S ribosomal protein L25 [Spirochaetota bacterium]|nr:50S ribosomal protein L25 [Spirochaetota bacterium]HOM38797.1 50S ribosomal protein L25 [Spirochaetota bacterium]HPQ49855.1 50S ribosomal protein L25 [Spirochaetota bacterium]
MLVFEVKKREPKKDLNKMRREGLIPGIIYGIDDNIPVFSTYKSFVETFQKVGGHEIIKIKIENKEIMGLIKDFQIHPLTDKFLHFDILGVTENRKISTRVPVKFVGEPKGVKEGGILEEFMTSLEIEVLVKDLPHSIDIDITNLKIGDSIHVKDIVPPKGVKILDDKDSVVVHIAGAKLELEEKKEESAITAPEVIKPERKKEESEETKKGK